MPKAVKLEIFGDPPNITDIDHPTVTKWYGDLSSIYNSLGFCLFASTVVDALGPTYMFDLYSTATGFKTTPEQLMETGERVFNLMRLYAIREGISVEDDDWKPDYYTEPSYAGIDEGPPFNKEIILKALRKYYDLRGWDKKTGKPTSETSKRLGLPSTI
jgi:aldehyde:ferredoxin oxidoreductase